MDNEDVLISIAVDEVLSRQPSVGIDALVRAARDCRLDSGHAVGIADLVVRIQLSLVRNSSSLR